MTNLGPLDLADRLATSLSVLARTVALLVLATQSVTAQVTFDGCKDIRGVAVASVIDFSLNDVAHASLAADGTPIIRYNPRKLSWFAPETRLWWYGHGCGHHALGHAFGTTHPLATEQAADCYGVNSLFDAGLLTRRSLEIIKADLKKIGPGDWTHLPGRVRAVNLSSCGSRSEREPCRHAAHPSGDVQACSHPVHVRGDIYPCQHPCPGYYGPVPCHPRGDVVPCSHSVHARGDVTPCSHPRHPDGH